MKTLLLFISLIASAALMQGCPPPDNSGGNTPAGSSQKTSSLNAGNGLDNGGKYTPPTSTSGSTFSIINAVVYSGDTPPAPNATPTASATPAPAASHSATSQMNTVLYFQSDSNTGTNVSSVCTAGTSGSASGGNSNIGPCLCRFSWTETNPTTGIGFTRTVDTTVKQPYPYMAVCPVPGVWDSEIPDGTSIDVTMIPDTRNGNLISFTANSVRMTKQSGLSSIADFRDAEGKAMKNIFHYTCYDYISKNLSIAHATAPGSPRSNGSPPPPQVPLANSFTTSNFAVSAQSYWYDFYVRGNEIGSINRGVRQSGFGFVCPKVKIYQSNLVNDQQQGSANPRFFPLDSSMALALTSSRKYPIAVQANIRVQPPTNGGGLNEVGTLGYAAKPNADGTCPAFPDSQGLTRRTFRLRRYVVTYPMRYDADGKLLPNSTQINNIVYIMDRPVDRTNQDATKPLTRLGPKPCPFSFNTGFSLKGTASDTKINHACFVGASKMPFTFGSNTPADYRLAGGTLNNTSALLSSFLHGISDGKKFGLTTTNDTGSVRGNARTYCLGNGTDSGEYLYDNLTTTCNLGSPLTFNSSAPNAQILDFVSPKNLDGTAIRNSSCPIFPPPATNLTVTAALSIRPQNGVLPEFLEDTNFKACAFQSSTPVDPDIVTVYNSYTYPQPGDRSSDNPQKARAFYCSRTYADPSWLEPEDGGATDAKLPGNCDSGRPKASDPTNISKYYIPKNTASSSEDRAGYIDFNVNLVKRSVPDGIVTSYAIMNERTYACAFTYNPSMKKSYSSTQPLEDLTTPRSGCCQRCSGGSKLGPCTAAATGSTGSAENRGVHSLVTPIGPWYNRYGKPAFNMQSVLLSAAPFQLAPNKGTLSTNASCYTAATGVLASTCQGVTSISATSMAGTAIVTGDWSGEVTPNTSTGGAYGCYDPSEDP